MKLFIETGQFFFRYLTNRREVCSIQLLSYSIALRKRGDHRKTDLPNITVCGQAPQIHLNQIPVLQKRALRLIYFSPYRSSAIPPFVSFGCLPISLLYFKAVSILIHDVLNNLSPRYTSNSQLEGGLCWHTNYYVTLTKSYTDKLIVCKV